MCAPSENKPVCFGQWGILKVSEFGGFVLRSVIFLLGEMFEGDSADMCAGKFPLMSMGGRADRQACADGERGPPSARAEIFFFLPPLFKTTEGVVVGFQIFAWAPKYHEY